MFYAAEIDDPQSIQHWIKKNDSDRNSGELTLGYDIVGNSDAHCPCPPNQGFRNWLQEEPL